MTATKPKRKQVTIGVDPETHRLVAEIAARNGRTIVGQIRVWIAQEKTYESVQELAADLPDPVKE